MGSMDNNRKESKSFVVREVIYIVTSAAEEKQIVPPPLSHEDEPRELEEAINCPDEKTKALADAYRVVLEKRLRDENVDEILKLRLVSNNIVQIMDDPRELRIDGIRIKLTAREYFFFLVLARHRKAGGGYLKTREIVKRIEQEIAKLSREETEAHSRKFWEIVMENDIFRIVKNLRGKIDGAGKQFDILETAEQKGQGYRLSVPAKNIDIETACHSEKYCDDYLTGPENEIE